MTFDVSIPGHSTAAIAAPEREDCMDEAAFSAFYERNRRPLWAYLARASGSPSLADDFAQESFLRLLRSGPWQQGEVACRRYLFRIAGNLLNDHWRRARSLPLEDAPEPALPPSVIAEPRLEAALARLKPRERQLLWLAYVEGHDHREIAAITGLRQSGLRMLLYRARRRLAGLLERVPV